MKQVCTTIITAYIRMRIYLGISTYSSRITAYIRIRIYLSISTSSGLQPISGSGSTSVSVPAADYSLHQDQDLPQYQYQQQDYILHQDQDLPQYQYLQQITAYIRIRIYLSTCSRLQPTSGSGSTSVPAAGLQPTLGSGSTSVHQDQDLPRYQYLQQDYSLHRDQDLPQYQYLQQITAYIRIRIYLCISTCSRITASIRDSNRPKQNELKAAQVMPRLVMLCQSFRIYN